MDSKELISNFIESKKYAWNELTQKNEKGRLMKLSDHITGNPMDLMQALEGVASYTFVSLWNRVIEIYDLKNANDNPYRKFKRENTRLFRNYYQRRNVDVSFSEAVSLVNGIEDEETRNKALDLLHTGLRWSESQAEEDGHVLGKGGKLRRVFRSGDTKPVIYSKHRSTFFRELKKVGLTAHMLRKLAATRLAELGMREQDLCKVFGWSSFETAKHYIQPKRDEEISIMMEAM